VKRPNIDYILNTICKDAREEMRGDGITLQDIWSPLETIENDLVPYIKHLEEALEGARETITTLDKHLWFDANQGGACMYCEANLHENAMGSHNQLNGDTCPVQVAHDWLEKYGGGE